MRNITHSCLGQADYLFIRIGSYLSRGREGTEGYRYSGHQHFIFGLNEPYSLFTTR